MRAATRVGMHVFAMVTPPAVAVVAVATDTPTVMLLFCLPAAVVGYTVYSDHRHPDPGHGTAARLPRPGEAAVDDAAVGRRQARLLRRALGHHGSTAHDLWQDCACRGGVIGEFEVDAYVHESLHLPPAERDLLVQAANALLDPRSELWVPTTAQLQWPEPHR